MTRTRGSNHDHYCLPAARAANGSEAFARYYRMHERNLHMISAYLMETYIHSVETSGYSKACFGICEMLEYEMIILADSAARWLALWILKSLHFDPR